MEEKEAKNEKGKENKRIPELAAGDWQLVARANIQNIHRETPAGN